MHTLPKPRTRIAFWAALVSAPLVLAAPLMMTGQAVGAELEIRFQRSDRVAVREYFEPEMRHGNCPPGLAKKRNGCQPPGQAKKAWSRGRPLPSNVVYEPLPRELVVRLTPPPAGHQYVRVAGDILLLATGTQMVVDAIADLGGALR